MQCKIGRSCKSRLLSGCCEYQERGHFKEVLSSSTKMFCYNGAAGLFAQTCVFPAA